MYQKQGNLGRWRLEYNEILKSKFFLEFVEKEMNEEVKRHLLNETQEFKNVQDDDPAMKYIANKIKGVIQREIKKSKQTTNA